MRAYDAFKEDLREDSDFLDRLYQEAKMRAMYGSCDVVTVKPSHLLRKDLFNSQTY